MSGTRQVSWKKMLVVLLIEFFTIVLIVNAFKYIPDRLLAARVVSGAFVFEGLLILLLLRLWLGRGWTFTVPMMVLFQVIFVLPMAVYRIGTTASFSDLVWMGIPGPILHLWSSNFYYALVASSFVDTARAVYCRVKQKK